MNKVVIYCKSFRRDVHRVKEMLKSIIKYNVDNIPFYISCPETDIQLFKDTLGTSGYTLVSDESIYEKQPQEDWTAQQILKCTFWKLGVCENYVVIDSDSYFIRPFYVSDFIAPNGNPYVVMHEQKELFSWTANKTRHLGFDPIDAFKDCRKKIMDIFGREGRYYDFGPSPVIWNSGVWKDFSINYLDANNLKMSDVIRMIPSEFTWYGEWLMTYDKTFLPVEPLFKVFHYAGQYVEAKQQGYTEEDFAKIYMGVVMQSNANIPVKY